MSPDPDLGHPEMPSTSTRGVPADDHVLLSRYFRNQNQEAFAELVARHHRLVRTTCRQALRNHDLADDATQIVFMILARKGQYLSRDVRLRGWLYQTARLVAADLRKQERRRQRRHNLVAETIRDRVLTGDTSDSQLRLTISDMIGRLPPQDRRAISLRFFDGMTLAEMAVAMRGGGQGIGCQCAGDCRQSFAEARQRRPCHDHRGRPFTNRRHSLGHDLRRHRRGGAFPKEIAGTRQIHRRGKYSGKFR